MAGEERSGVKATYQTGNGRILMRGRAEIQPFGKTGDRHQIVITEIPYQLNKATLVEKIAHLARDKKIDGISDVRDESDRQGMRVVVELRSHTDPVYVLSNLYEQTPLQMTYNMNMLALVDGQPQVLTVRDVLHHYIEFRIEVITRRAQFDLDKARERDHILIGLLKAIDNLDEVIALIRSSDDADIARSSLMSGFDITQIQAQAILDMQLRRLTALDSQRLEVEHAQLTKTIGELTELLSDPGKVRSIAREENQEIRKKFGDKRRTEIIQEDARRLTRDELIAHADMVVTLSMNGYAKRTNLSTYKLQHRGGKGVLGMRTTKEDDVIHHTLVTDTKDTILLFTDGGKVFSFKCYHIPEDISRTTRGTPIKVLIPSLPENEKITSIVALSDLRQGGFLTLGTQRGIIKRVPLDRFASIRSIGIIAMDLDEGDHLISARATRDGDEIMVVTRNGMSVCFPVTNLRVLSRTARGVRAIRLKEGDFAISMDVVNPRGSLLAVSEKGFGKLTRMDKFRRQSRGGSGVIAFKVDARTGPLAATLVVEGTEQLVIATAKAQVERIQLSEVGVQGRYARGVWVLHPAKGDRITSLAILTPSTLSILNKENSLPAIPQEDNEVSGGIDSPARLAIEIEEALEGAEDLPEENPEI
jgi:DNA gyrase subunit A